MATSPDRKVLIVDDDQALGNLMVMLLQLEGLAAEAAFSGQQALDSIARELPAAVILDIMMPDMDGFSIVRRLRADERTARLPVLMLSARVDPESRELSLAAGANSYLTKPADPELLTAELKAVIAGSDTSLGG